jgi:glycosyltransferase involved in cell wall biosynthesis
MTLRLMAVIPAHDAGATVGAVVRDTARFVDAVVCVDDGSRDTTAPAAAAAGAMVIAHPHNRGKGAALRTGMTAAFTHGADAVVTLDADGQHLPDQIPALLRGMASGADLVLGCRAAAFAAMSPLRRAANRLSSRLISFAAGQRIADVQTGFRIYGREMFLRLGLHGNGFEAESAIVVRAARRGFRIRSVPVRLAKVDGRATSHYRPIRDSLRIAQAVTWMRLLDDRRNAPQEVEPARGPL